jgi:YHS domain-containing protein
MKTTIQLLAGLTAATLLLSSCGDKKTTETDSPPETPEAKAYPLDVCVISGEKLGSMGKPHIVSHKGTDVQLCCDDCLTEFNKDPDKYVSMVKSGKAGKADDHTGHDH